jgi:hypothetical protein
MLLVNNIKIGTSNTNSDIGLGKRIYIRKLIEELAAFQERQCTCQASHAE